MESLLGFHVGFWDYVTFLAIFVIVVAFLSAAVFILGLPGRIAIARKHPEADAVYLMGWIGFLAVVPWVQALIWAFKPTTVIDIRDLPKERQRETDAMMARLDRLEGKAPSPHAPLAEPPGRRPTS
jgi:Protein of unknown function (DUF3302)